VKSTFSPKTLQFYYSCFHTPFET